jgi:hypothetical protein
MRTVYLFLTFIFFLLSLRCNKHEQVLEEPKPIIQLLDCGTLDYWHSMFIINNQCYGENLPESVYFTEDKKFTCIVNFIFEKYTTQLILWQTGEFNFVLGLFVLEGDGVLSTYRLPFLNDKTYGINFQFNKDSTEFTGTVKNVKLTGGGSKLLGLPDTIFISDGSFRMPVKK